MATFLKNLYEDLLKIRTYLIKIGPSRRTGDILKKKFGEAKFVVQQYNNYIEQLDKIEV